MYNTKQKIYLYFDKTQKSTLCSFLRSFVKNNLKKNEFNITEEELFKNFIEEQEYYFKINSSRFPFLKDYLDDEAFISETKQYIGAIKQYYEYKKSQEFLKEKQKDYEKSKREFLKEVKMSKEKPTKKQIYYYEKLCRKYNIDKKDTSTLSKLDIKNELERILNEHSKDYRNINIERD